MSREADLRYIPQMKDLSVVVCSSDNTPYEREIMIKVLDRLIKEYDNLEDVKPPKTA